MIEPARTAAIAQRTYRVECKHARGVFRVSVTGAWFPKRDDVAGVRALRDVLMVSIPASFYDQQDGVFVDVYVTAPHIGLDRALSGVCCALDAVHGTREAPLWDDNVIRQARVTRLGPQQQHKHRLPRDMLAPEQKE